MLVWRRRRTFLATRSGIAFHLGKRPLPVRGYARLHVSRSGGSLRTYTGDNAMPWRILICFFRSRCFAERATSPNPGTTGAKRPFTFEDMMALKRVGEPVPSPDGKWVVFAAVDVDLEANTKISHLWIVPAAGGEARRLNQTPNHEERPRFSPDGKRLIWTSKATDPTQIWMSNFTPESGGLDGTPHQVTNISTGADGAIWSPDGKNIVFLSSVYPDCNSPSLATARRETTRATSSATKSSGRAK